MLEGLSSMMGELEAQKIRVNRRLFPFYSLRECLTTSFDELNNISSLITEINDMFEINEIQKPVAESTSFNIDSSPNVVNINSPSELTSFDILHTTNSK
jgi:hypothetical protein